MPRRSRQGEPIVITAPVAFGDRVDLDRLALPPPSQIPSGACLVVDLRAMLFAAPAALVGTLAAVDGFMADSPERTARLMFPRDREMCDYLRMIGFADAVAGIVGLPQPSGPAAISEVSALLPICSGTTERWVEEIAYVMGDRFRSERVGLAGLLPASHNVLAELAGNAVEHSRSRRVWAVAQLYAGSGRIVIAVADSGIGIRAALEQNEQYCGTFESDISAVRAAFLDGVSGLSDTNRGYGLGFVVHAVSRPARRLLVRSGFGCVVVYYDGRVRAYPCQGTVGTLATVNIPFV